MANQLGNFMKQCVDLWGRVKHAELDAASQLVNTSTYGENVKRFVRARLREREERRGWFVRRAIGALR
jgi:hypothetical protein